MLTFQINVFTFTMGSPITPTDIQKRKYIEIGYFRNVSQNLQKEATKPARIPNST